MSVKSSPSHVTDKAFGSLDGIPASKDDSGSVLISLELAPKSVTNGQ